MSDNHSHSGVAKSLGVFLDGEAIAGRGPRGERVPDATCDLLFKAHHARRRLTLPRAAWCRRSTTRLDTTDNAPADPPPVFKAGRQVACESRSAVVRRRTP